MLRTHTRIQFLSITQHSFTDPLLKPSIRPDKPDRHNSDSPLAHTSKRYTGIREVNPQVNIITNCGKKRRRSAMR